MPAVVIRDSEAKLREMEHRYRSIFENSTEGIFQTSIDGHYLSVNPALAKIYGYESADDLIHSVQNIGAQLYVDPARRAQFQEAMATHGRVNDFISEVFRKDGSRIWIRENAHVVRGHDGDILYYEGWVEDFTEKYRAENEMLRAKAAAEEASRAKSGFLATMSHELRTPLNGILGMSEILAGTRLDADQEDCVRTIQQSAETLLSLVNDVLDFSKIEAGHLGIEAIPVVLENVVDETMRLLAPLAEAKGLQFTVDWGEAVPHAILGDPLRLRQCLSNLLNNAIKFTAKGGVYLRVRLSDAHDGLARIRFEIEDTGIGLNAETASRLFQPFCQGDASTTRRFGGTGLGLAIVQRLARMMGGEAGLRSQQGVGSIFHFEVALPTLDQNASEGAERVSVVILAPDQKVGRHWATSFRRAGAKINAIVTEVEQVPPDAADILVAPADAKLPNIRIPTLRVSSMSLGNPPRMSEVRRALRIGPWSQAPSVRDVLVVNTNALEQKVLTIQLHKLGLSARAADISKLPTLLKEPHADLMVVDCELPNVYELIETRRRFEQSGSGRLKIIGLIEPNTNQAERCRAAGADACLSKPVHPQKLTALLREERIVA